MFFLLLSTECFVPVYWISHSRHRTLNTWPLSLADDLIKLSLSGMQFNSICVMFICVFVCVCVNVCVCLYVCLNVYLCVPHPCVHFFFLIISPCTLLWSSSALPPIQCLSFLSVGRLIFPSSEICLANKPLTRQKEGLGHCLDMREKRVLNHGAR